MFELFRNSVTLQTAPRIGLVLWGIHRLPLASAFGSLVFWATAIGVGLAMMGLALDCWLVTRRREERREARYWADLRARQGRRDDVRSEFDND